MPGIYRQLTGERAGQFLERGFVTVRGAFDAAKLALREPMNFNRPKADDFSLVERAVLRGLGVDRLDFVPAAPREDVVPERVRKQRAREVAENARLAAAERAVIQ
jgi:hypothetical protein